MLSSVRITALIPATESLISASKYVTFHCSEAAEGGHADACIESAEENAWLFENIARDRGPHYVGTYQAPLPAPFPSANWGNWVSPRCSSTYTAWYAPWGEPNDYGREEASSSLIPIILPRFRF